MATVLATMVALLFGSTTPARAQEMAAINPFDEMIEAADAVARAAPYIGRRVWPGFWPAGQAFMFYRPADEVLLLVTDEPPPVSFEAVPAENLPPSLHGRLYLHHGMLPGLESGFNNEFRIGDITAVAVQWTSSEPIEEVLATLFHEGFHAHQSDHFDGSSTRYFVRPELIDTPEFRAMAEVERRMLVRALVMPADALSEHLRRYLAVRRMRLAALPDTVRVRESQVERTEGSAALVGHHASLYAIDDLDRMVDVLRSIYLVKPLTELGGGVVEQLMRWRVYGTGAAIGVLLDRLPAPAWRDRLSAGATFDELLGEAVDFAPRDAEVLAASGLEEFGYARLVESTGAAAEAPRVGSLDDFRALVGASVLLELPVPIVNGEAELDLYFSAPDFTQIEEQFLYMAQAESLTLQLPYGSIVVEGRPVLLDMRMASGMVLSIAIGLSHPARFGDAEPAGAPGGIERLTLTQPGVEIRIDRRVVVRAEGSAASVRLAE